MASYFAVIMPATEGGYVVAFPDLPEAFTQGETLDECLIMGADVLSIVAEEYIKARRELPTPMCIADVKAWAQIQKSEQGILPSGEVLFQLFKAPEVDATPVRVSVSIGKSDLHLIDEKAQSLGFTRSGLLVAAAKAYPQA